MDRPTAPAPAMATRMAPSALVRAVVDDRVGVRGVLLAHHDVQDVALLDHALARRQGAFTEPVDPGDAAVGLELELDGPVTDPRLGRRDLVDPDGAGGVAEVGLRAGREQSAEHLVSGPLDRRDRGDAEPLVDLGAARVVDPGDDGLDPEALAGDPRGDDVGVVTARHGGERVGTAYAGLLQDLLVEALAGDLVTVEARAQAPEGVGVAVDDRHGVVAVLEAARQCGTDAPTAHDHDVHGADATCIERRGCTARHTVGLAFPLVGVSDVSKRILLGRKLRSSQLGETLLPKRIALPVFASDALSSVAYAPDEIFIMLSLAGASAFVWSWKIGIAVALVMAAVVASYRQTVHAYPSGGGDYEVATVNLGPTAGVTVASALLVDYVLTVAVSISSGAQYAASAIGPLNGHEATVATLFVVLLAAMNLRGIRESGSFFAVPTYLFMVAILGMCAYGLIEFSLGDLPMAESASFGIQPAPGYGDSMTSFALTFLLARAFSSGC